MGLPFKTKQKKPYHITLNWLDRVQGGKAEIYVWENPRKSASPSGITISVDLHTLLSETNFPISLSEVISSVKAELWIPVATMFYVHENGL